MKYDGQDCFLILRDLPPLTARFCRLVGARQGEERGARIMALALDRPEHLAELTRGMRGSSDYESNAAITAGLLMAMTLRGQGGESDMRTFKPMSDVMLAFNRLFLPLATQKPQMALEIVSAGLAEPNMPVFVRDGLTAAFTDASFALLRSQPGQTLKLLDVLSRHASEPGSHYISEHTRAGAVQDLARVLDRYVSKSDRAGQNPAINGNVTLLPAPVALHVAEAASTLSRDPQVKAALDQQALRLRQRVQKPEPA